VTLGPATALKLLGIALISNIFAVVASLRLGPGQPADP
jgi:hypothetical protein